MTLEEKQIEGVNVISVSGDADLRGVPEFQEVARKYLDRGDSPFVVDFEAATFVNTPVWAVVVECYQRSGKSGQSFGVCGLKARVKDSFDIVRLGEFVRHFPTSEEAISALKIKD